MYAPEIVTLRNGDLKLALAPSIGGAIVGFWRAGFALMRETPEHALREGLVRQTSSYPLIPYSNRIAYGRFSFDGVEHELALNFGDHPHSVHGNAWQRSWQVEEADDTTCRLALDHRAIGEDAKAWPFSYRAEQVFTLDANRLEIMLTLENQDHRAMPARFGLHPFFPRHSGTMLRFEASGVYRTGPDSLPAEKGPVPQVWDFRRGLLLEEPHLDNCFIGWTGGAEIRFEGHHLTLHIEADPVFDHLVVYVPPDRDFFAVEPVSHMNDAVNRPPVTDKGLKILQPGETLIGTVLFRVEATR